MNRHQRMEAKRARRARRRSPDVARAHTGHPAKAEQVQARQARHARKRVRADERRQVERMAVVEAGAERMTKVVAPLVKAEQAAAKERVAALERAGRPPVHDPLVPVPCDCDPPRPHGPHRIASSKVKPEHGRISSLAGRLAEKLGRAA